MSTAEKCPTCADAIGERDGRFRVVIAFTHDMERFLSEYDYDDKEAHALWHKCKNAGLNTYVERVSS